MSSMLQPSIILPPETAPDEPTGSQTPTVDPNTGLNPYFDQFNQMQQSFQSTMQDIQNDPFPLLEQFLGQRAMSQVDQAMQPMQQEAIQKVSGVMSGIRSLVNEAFPNMGGGGIASLGGTAIPAAPFTKPAEIPSTPMQPSMMGDLSQISTPQPIQGGESIGDKLFGTKMTDIVGSFGSEVTTPAFTGPNSQNTYVGGVKVGGSQPMVGGSGMGNPMALIEPPMIPKIADIGPVTAISQEKEYNPAMEYNFPKPDFSIVDNPIQKQVEDPLINLAYNFNMENSPF